MTLKNRQIFFVMFLCFSLLILTSCEVIGEGYIENKDGGQSVITDFENPILTQQLETPSTANFTTKNEPVTTSFSKNHLTTVERTTHIEPTSVPTTQEYVVTTSETIKNIERGDSDIGSVHKNIINECIFAGDSVCSGLSAYGRVPEEKVIAYMGFTAASLYKNSVEIEGEEVRFTKAIGILKPKYLVIWLGSNDVVSVSKDKYAENYLKLVRAVRVDAPGVKIISLSETPVSAVTKYKLVNSEIREYNDYLTEALKSETYITRILIDEIFKDSYGNLAKEYDGGDGLHLNGFAYDTVLKILGEQLGI